MRPVRAPRGRSRGGMMRGSSRGVPGRGTSFSRGRGSAPHFPQKRGSFNNVSNAARSTKRSYDEVTPSRSTTSYEHQSSSSSRHYGEPAEKYYSYGSSSSNRGSYKPKYTKYQSESLNYHHHESHRSPSPRRRSHSEQYESEAPSHRSNSSHYRGDHQEERYERSFERYEEHRPQERYQSSRDPYREEVGAEPLEPPPPPLISKTEDYLPAPKVMPQRGRGAMRGVKRAPFRTYGSTTVVSSQKAALLAKKKLALATGRTFKRPTFTKVVRPRVFEVNPECPDQDPEANDDADDTYTQHRPKLVPHSRSGYKFIPLQCPHCKLSCTTFHQYKIHLTKKRHIIAMVKVEADIKQRVISMRSQQRKQQNQEEEKPDPEKPLSEFTSFCPTCKLNYRQSKEIHESSKMHVEIKQFLYPTCTTCNIKFKSARFYEQHLCSLEHIRTVASKKETKKEKKDNVDEVGEIDREALDILEGFMVVDSVGEDDDDDVEKEELYGVDRIKTVEALFCELCQRFLPRLDDVDKAKSVHCRSSLHKKNFEVSEKTKARHAEEDKSKDKETAEEHTHEKEKPVAVQEEEKDEIADDEAIWRDVDRDIGELLKDRNDDINSNISAEDVQLSPV
ncbi:Hypothetical predicted protein [Cloeon dipterum]|uniref:C2H2-type domain-containing protein n=1 Tax=Cloeon dipterum TaxID=197152 RepID=A0A8S1C6B0_9INSE|nr:Hypothetical predicted protein [Cloeon dipterum]